MALSYDYTAFSIGVPQVEAMPLLMQDLLNSIRGQEASEDGIAHSQIADASGKADLGGGVFTGITVALRDSWKLDFEAGVYQATVTGGNLAEALSRVINTGNPQVLMLLSAGSTIVTVSTGSGLSTAEHDALMGIPPTLAGTLKANVKQVNDRTIKGTGVPGDTWGPA